MEKLLNFVQEPDVPLLEQVVQVMLSGSATERASAQNVLTTLQQNPDMWQRVDTILECAQSVNTKFFALQILESLIKYRWKAIPREQSNAIKNYVISLILKLSSTEQAVQQQKLVLDKLNLLLVQVIKQEWPRHWQTVIPELVQASQSAETVCENNMHILRLLSEEIFDLSQGQMTQAKIAELKNSFNKEFSLIYKLCESILEHSNRASLVQVTLETLLRFLSWIPLGYIFETKMIDVLIFKFFPVAMFRNLTLKCLNEIGSLSVGNLHDLHFAKLYCLTIQQLRNILPLETDIATAYEGGSADAQNFIQDLALFLTGFFKAHLAVVEMPEYQPFLLEGHMYLANVSLVSDVEIFKICLEYWNIIAADLYNETPFLNLNNPSPRRALYAPVLSKVRAALISRMPKPEEVLVVEDEGEIVREQAKDLDAIILYKSMRETLIYLTHLDADDTQAIMLHRLARQMDGTDWSWHNLSTLCWAMGSISGAMTEEDEKKFLVTVIKDLLGLCEMKRGKDNKAVVAANIMYIVGQYPRFLRAHWKFLRTVVYKLFEFMHELHPGVQDMACDTYLKIAQKCRRKFVVTQLGETEPFIVEVLTTLPNIISELQPSQIQTFYEATGCMIGSSTEPRAREELIARFMELPNQTWAEIMRQAAANLEVLRNPETAKSLANILRTNTRAAMSLGHFFVTQLGRIFMDLLNLYKVYSETISAQVASGGAHVSLTPQFRAMRSVKKEILRLLQCYVEKCEDPAMLYANFIPPMLQAVLGDYKSLVPEARDAEVLSLLTSIINKLKGNISGDIPRILEHVFEPTLAMITRNFEDNTDHRVHFFSMLRAINQHCFQSFFMISQQQFKLVIDSIVWAFKHPTRDIAEIGLYTLLELWRNILGTPVANAFFQAYFLSLLQDIFSVLTDTFHKSNLKLHATMLMQMVNSVESGQVAAPLWDPSKVTDPATSNSKFLREYLAALLARSFTNLNPTQIQLFVNGLFTSARDLSVLKNHIRDFLVQLKEFQGDNAELYLEEAEVQAALAKEQELKKKQHVPGMIAPHDKPGFDLDM